MILNYFISCDLIIAAFFQPVLRIAQPAATSQGPSGVIDVIKDLALLQTAHVAVCSYRFLNNSFRYNNVFVFISNWKAFRPDCTYRLYSDRLCFI